MNLVGVHSDQIDEEEPAPRVISPANNALPPATANALEPATSAISPRWDHQRWILPSRTCTSGNAEW
jgi:hypothetical protein